MMVTKKASPMLLAGATVLLSCVSVVLFLEVDHVIAWIGSSSLQRSHNRVSRAFVPAHLLKTKTTVVNFGVTGQDGDLSKDSEPSILAYDDADTSTKRQSSPSQIQEEGIPSLKPQDLEESLLSQHDNLESYISETKKATAYNQPEDKKIEPPIARANIVDSSRSTPYFLRPVPYFLQPKGNTNNNIRTKKERKFVGDDDWKGDGKHEKIETKQAVSLAKVKGASIDQAIFNFNKNLVDGLYAVISLLYPVSSPSEEQVDPETARVNDYLLNLLGTEYNEGFAPTMILRFQKFYIFETVARIPYFAYLSVLHLRESLGDRGYLRETENKDFDNSYIETETVKHQNNKRIETMRTHYAQADNELHHLLIMEALGGNSRGVDRFLAHTMAFFYYWFVVFVFFWNEQASYHLNEVIEDHAYKIYDEFLTLYEDELRDLPVPDIARKYYESDFRKNPHLFETFCAVSKGTEMKSLNKSSDDDPRKNKRPHELKTLYDVFRNIRDDEKEHWMALCNLVQYDDIFAVEESHVKSTIGRKR